MNGTEPGAATQTEEPRNVIRVYVSPERYQRIVEWQRHPRYNEDPYEAHFDGNDPEEPDPPTGQDIDNPAIANYARLVLELWKRCERLGRPRPSAYGFWERFLLIHDFRRQALDDLTPLAKAMRWHPATDPHTLRRFRQWRADRPVQPGEPDAYTQLMMTALLLMTRPKDGTEVARDRTPQAIRLGGRWIERAKRKHVPLDISLADYLRWYRNEVTRIVKREILRGDDVESMDRAELHGRASENGDWIASSVEASQVRRYRDAERAHRDEWLPPEDEHPLDHVTPTSARLRELGQRVRRAGVIASSLQRAILEFAAEDAHLPDYRELAERLGRDRDTVKNAVLRLRRKLPK